MIAPPVTLESDEALLFLHIPKTAGTTLNAVLDEQFLPQEARELPSWSDLPKHKIDYAPFRFLRGHVFYDVHKVLPRRLRYMTMLRDPIERTISNYEMMRRMPNDPWHGVVREMSFADYVADPRTQPLFVNTQTRLIGSEWPIRRIADIATTAEVMPPDVLDIAKRRLGSFDFVGLTEKFEQSMELLFYTFGWYPRPVLENLMVAPQGRLRREDLSQATLRDLQDMTALDSELYLFAETLFKKRRSQMSHDVLAARWRSVQASNHDAIVSVDFGGPWSGTGWYMREVHPHHGHYRWIGPDTTAGLWVPVPNAARLQVRFRVIASCSNDILHDFSFAVGGETVPLQMAADPMGGIVFSGQVPLQVLAPKQPVIELTWALPYTRHPSSWDPLNPDPRQLGMALNLVELVPAG